MLKRKSNSLVINQWSAINKELQYWRWGCILAIFLSLMLGGLSFYLAKIDPVIFKEQEGQKFIYKASPTSIPLNPQTVGDLVKSFVHLRYTWDQYSTELILENLTPVTTRGFRNKLQKLLKKEKGKKIKGKKVTQKAIDIFPTVTEKEVRANFDLIVKIDSLPLIRPMSISLRLVQGSQNSFNPWGLYIDGLTEHEL